MIVAVEGIDGAGKNTLVTALRERIDVDVLAFPRYEVSIHAQLAQQALHGRMGDLTESAYAMATLFALDRHGSLDTLAEYVDSDRVIVLDRYVASNAAYSLARTGDEKVVDWVAELEFERLGLPRPDLQVLLDTPPAIASERAINRAAQQADRARDAYERDGGLQRRTWEAYLELAKRQWGSEWVITSDAEDIIRFITS
ncbi:MAG: dTMP kinase [Corynebacterium sp.]|uniref:dTMP kinase n=1 Tax=Corynebacterium sp. TaxID=1720 RepID=UPI0026F56E5A|nr:dTMP kinase [Corynebacterium sp.]